MKTHTHMNRYWHSIAANKKIVLSLCCMLLLLLWHYKSYAQSSKGYQASSYLGPNMDALFHPTEMSVSACNSYTWYANTYTASGTYIHTSLNAAGCIDKAILQLTILPPASVTVNSNVASICAAGNIPLYPSNTSAILTATAATTYSWQPGGFSTFSISVSPALTTTYTVTGTNGAGCTKTATKTITVNPLPIANAGPDITLTCNLGSAVLGTPAVSGYSYFWSQPIQYFTIQSPSQAQPTILANPDTLANITYALYVSSLSTNCTSSDFVTVTMNTIKPNVIITSPVTSICTGTSTTITATGANTYNWQPGNVNGSSITVSPASTTTYTVTGTSTANACTKTATRLITVNQCTSTLNLTCFIQGYWNGSNAMLPVLFNQGQSLSTTVCDSIKVELHNATSPYATAYTTNAVLNTNGSAICTFNGTITGNYYIVVKHRNALQTWSALPVAMGPSVTYNFTTSATQAYDVNTTLLPEPMTQVAPGIWAFYSGDVEVDENIDLLDLGLVETDVSEFVFAYFYNSLPLPPYTNGYRLRIDTDLNGDGNVDLLDTPSLESNISNFIFSNHP